MKKIMLILSALILVGLVSAAGIASIYTKDNPLRMNYGETKTVELNLQNMVGDEDITVEVEIKKGADIASIEQTTYTAEAGTSDTMIPIKITVPNDYSSTSQEIEVLTKTVTSSQGGTVTFGTGWTVTFDAVLSEAEEQEKSGSSLTIILIAAIIIIAVIIFVLYRKRNS